MIKKIKNVFKFSAIIFAAGMLILNCESESDTLGEQFFQSGTASGEQSNYDVIAYNISNRDSIRVDSTRLQLATLGAFTEPVFGMQKSSYITQLRMTSYPPDFGTNAVADSAVLVIKPQYATDSATTTTNTNYVYPVGNVAAKKVVTTYPITKYGKSKINGQTKMTLKVYEVTDFLGSYNDKIFSDRDAATGTLLGSKIIDGTINSIVITKNSDNSELLNNDLGIRIPLDGAFFQNKIISKKGSPDLTDPASFIRYFKGLKITVEENDGYIFRFVPSNVSLRLYYQNDVTTNGTTTKTAQRYDFDLSPYIPGIGGSNLFFNNIKYDRSGTPIANISTTTPNTTSGDAKLYAQGMGGPGFGIKIPDATVNTIRDLYNKQKISIVSAKIRLYTDTSVWNNNYTKPATLIPTKQDNLYKYLKDLWEYSALGYTPSKFYSTNNPPYYDLGITKTFKDIIESNVAPVDLRVNVGSFRYTTDGIPLGLKTGNGEFYKYSYNLNDRSYTPNRIVLVGTDPSNANRAQLIITYGKK